MPRPAANIREALDSLVAIVLARLVIPALTIGCLTFSGFVGKRVLDVLDTHTKQISEIHVAMASREMFSGDITRQRDNEIKSIREAWLDHEQRIRILADRLASRGQR